MESTRAFPAMGVSAVASGAWRARAQRACPPEPPRVSTRAATEVRWSSARTTRARTRITKPWRSTRRRPSSIATSSVCVSSAPTNNAHALTPGRDDRVSPPRLSGPTRHAGDSDAARDAAEPVHAPARSEPPRPTPEIRPVDLTRRKGIFRAFLRVPTRQLVAFFRSIRPGDENAFRRARRTFHSPRFPAPPRTSRHRLPRNPPKPDRRDAAHDAGGHRPPARRRGRDVHVRHAAR